MHQLKIKINKYTIFEVKIHFVHIRLIKTEVRISITSYKIKSNLQFIFSPFFLFVPCDCLTLLCRQLTTVNSLFLIHLVSMSWIINFDQTVSLGDCRCVGYQWPTTILLATLEWIQISLDVNSRPSLCCLRGTQNVVESNWIRRAVEHFSTFEY